MKNFCRVENICPLVSKKCDSWLLYWGARMHQIAKCFVDSSERCNLSEAVHGRWFKTGGTNLSIGGAAAFDIVEAIQAQVNFLSCMIPCSLDFLLVLYFYR
jgi:hypothetical protein